jgi:uncharacterized protein
MKQILKKQDLLKLENFLTSDQTPSRCMNLFSLDGFITCLMIGPETVVPSRWIPQIWGETEDEEMIWNSMKETEHFMGLIMTYYNMVSTAIQNNPKNYRPLMFQRNATENSGWHIEDWCHGFIIGINLTFDEWQPLLKSEEDKALIAPLLLFTSDKGLTTLKEDEGFRSYTGEKWEDVFKFIIGDVHEYWLPYRKEMRTANTQAISHKIGRNAPCPCGSGKKYKVCCMN